MIGAPKSLAGHRIIPLPAGAVAALKEWKLACPVHPLDLVFPSPKGRALSHRVLLKDMVGPIQVAAGVVSIPAVKSGIKEKDEDFKPTPRYAMHAFRHAAASLWIEQGINPKRVQALMGHSSIQITFDTYGHLFEQAEKDAEDANAIERALFADAT